jgi:hypothetical protein
MNGRRLTKELSAAFPDSFPLRLNRTLAGKNFCGPLETKNGFFYFSDAAARWRTRRL